MNMPARQFFAMTRASGKLLAIERLDECDISAIPMCHSDYYKKLKDSYLSKVVGLSLPMEPEQAPRGAVDSASDEAKYALSSLMANLKRSTH